MLVVVCSGGAAPCGAVLCFMASPMTGGASSSGSEAGWSAATSVLTLTSDIGARAGLPSAPTVCLSVAAWAGLHHCDWGACGGRLSLGLWGNRGENIWWYQ